MELIERLMLLRGVQLAATAGRRAYASLAPHQMLWAQGRPADGVVALRRTLADRPHDVELRKELLDMLIGVGDYREALALASALVAERHGCATTLAQRGVCQAQLGHPQQAAQDWAAALALDPHHHAALRSLARVSEPLRALELLARAAGAAEDASEEAEALCERAQVLLKALRVDEAVAEANRALSVDDRCAPAYLVKADALLRRQDHLAALQVSLCESEKWVVDGVQNYQRFWDTHERYYCERGTGAVGAGDLVLAELCVKRCACFAALGDWDAVGEMARLPLDMHTAGVALPPPLHGMAHYYAARALEAGGDTDAALAGYERAGSLGARAALFQQSVLLERLGRGAEAAIARAQLEQQMAAIRQ